MIRNIVGACVFLASFLPTVTLAAPGVGGKVYGATVEAGKTELEARYGRLAGGPDDGEDGLVLEVAHGFSKKLYVAALAEFEREPGSRRRLEALAIEAITPLGRIESLKLDVALYGEYETVRGGRDALESKLLLQHQHGKFDGRLNLTAAKALRSGAPLEFEYAASADWAIGGEFRAGLAAFGELGTTDKFLPRAQHFIGPIVKTEIEHLPGNSELEIEAGYLRAVGAARDDTKGQFRLLLEWEFRF
jgi:hypothetical protein